MRTEVKLGLLCIFAVVLGTVIYFIMNSNAHPTPAMGADNASLAAGHNRSDPSPDSHDPSAAPATPNTIKLDGLRVAAGPVGEPAISPPSTAPALVAPGSGGTPAGERLLPPAMGGAGGPAGGLPRTDLPVTPSPIDVPPLPKPSFGGGLGTLGGGGSAPAGGGSTAGASTYKVQKGDNFTTIAKHFNVSIAALEDANKGVDSAKLQINQTLNIPAAGTGIKPATTHPAAATRPTGGTPAASTRPASGTGTTASRHAGLTGGAVAAGSYEVIKGDTFTAIAKKYKVTLASLESANPSIDPNHISEGQTIKIP